MKPLRLFLGGLGCAVFGGCVLGGTAVWLLRVTFGGLWLAAGTRAKEARRFLIFFFEGGGGTG